MSENAGGKKGLHPMAWVGIGCGVFVLVGIIAVVLVVGWGVGKVQDVAKDFEENPERAIAQLAVKGNKNIDLVSTDDAAGTMTIRMKDTGEEVTLSYQDIAEGKFSVTTAEGTTTVDGSGGKVTTTTPDGGTTVVGDSGGVEKMPQWFDLPDGLTGWQSLMHSERGGKVSAILKAESTKPMDEMAAALKASLEAKGFEQVGDVGLGASMSVTYRNKTEGRNVSLSMSKENGKDFVLFTVTER